MAIFIGFLEGCFYKLCTVFLAYLISNDFSCIQVDDNTNIIRFSVAFKIGNITYPYLIGSIRIKFLIQIIFVSLNFISIKLFCFLPNAYKSHIVH